MKCGLATPPARSAVVLPSVDPAPSMSGRVQRCSAFTVKRKASGTSDARASYSATDGVA